MPGETDVLIIGGGQAGLATSYCLKERGIDHVIVDRGKIGDTWRQRWDAFCLVTKNWQCQLPGHSYDGDHPDGFMLRDEIVRYVERYAAKFDPPFRGGIEVTRLRKDGDRFVAETTDGEYRAPTVVVATGTYQYPRIPPWAEGLAPSIRQLHTRDYRNPDQLPEGAVLVVGSGQSGCQVVEDLEKAGRTVHLAVGNAGRIPRRYRGKDVLEWADAIGMYEMKVEDHPQGLAIRFAPHPHVTGRDGGRTIDLRELALRGIQLHGHLTGLDGTRATFAPDLAQSLDAADAFCAQVVGMMDQAIEAKGLPAGPPDLVVHAWQPGPPVTELDLAEAGITSIVWGTGYRYDFSWIELPILDDRGYPRYDGGVAEEPGLYFVGLHWLRTWGSGLFYSVGRDAEHIAHHIAARS